MVAPSMLPHVFTPGGSEIEVENSSGRVGQLIIDANRRYCATIAHMWDLERNCAEGSRTTEVG